MRNVCLDFVKYFKKIQILEKFKRQLCKKISILWNILQTPDIGNLEFCEIFCRIQIFEIMTMQLAIKDHNPMAEYQDDGLAELTVTYALLLVMLSA